MQIGGYTVERELARGGMGVVQLARDAAGDPVAIKLLLTAGANPEQLERFNREAKALAALDHPGVLGVREHGVDQGRPFLVMDYLPGQTLKERVEAEGPLAEGRALELARGIAAALVHAHRQGIVHRDLKPANVILHDGRPVLVDFGLALALDPTASRLTETGTIMGSPNFMAPEQAQGEKDVGPAADVYALGATLYFLLTGKPPFEGKSVLAILERVVGELPRSPRELRPELSAALEAVVLRCLEKHPGDRYPSAFALEGALEQLSAPRLQAPTSAPPAAVLVVTTLLAALGLGGLGVMVGTRDSRESTAAERDPGDPAKTFLEQGGEHLQAQRWAEAAEAFSAALDLDPSDAEAFFGRAGAQAGLGRMQEALADYERAFELNPDREKIHINMGLAKARLDRHEEALTDLERALEREPNNADIHLLLGHCRLELEDPNALADFDRAVALEPERARLWAERGHAKLKSALPEAALADFERALVLDGTETGARYGRAHSLDALQRHQEALDDTRLLLEADPSNPDYQILQASCLYSLQLYIEAAYVLVRALPLLRGDPRYDALLAAQRTAATEGIKALNPRVRADPKNVNLLMARATCYLALEDLGRAATDYSRIRSEVDDFAPAVFGQGLVLQLQGEHELALRQFERALGLGSDDPMVHFWRGVCLDALARTPEADLAFERAKQGGVPEGSIEAQRAYAAEKRR